MSTSVRSIPAAATGAVFAVTLFVANGDGGSVSTPRRIAASVALTLLIAFTVYVADQLRRGSATATDGWLATAAGAAGAVGACMKLLSDAPDIARSQSGIVPGGQTATALTAVADATTILALFPLALFCLAVGIVGVRTRALPRWLAIAALAAGAVLAGNACVLHTDNVPGLLAMTLWCLLASIHLVREARRDRPAGALDLGAAANA